ncbi:MAG: hypothetical protein ACYC2H_01315 [Thermoplasmatota archaeon]
MATARDIIEDALRELGVIGAHQTPKAADLSLGLRKLNRWVTNLETQRAAIFTVRREVFPLTAGTPSYTIGPGGAFNTSRPLRISHVGLVLDRTVASPIEIPLGHPMTDQEYQRVPSKSLTAPQPAAVYYDHGFTGSGLGAIYPMPIPSTSVCDLVLYLPRAMQEFANLSTDYAFPPGYEQAIVSNLALSLAASFEREPRASTVEEARASMAAIKRANARPRILRLDAALTGHGQPYNVWTDQ